MILIKSSMSNYLDKSASLGPCPACRFSKKIGERADFISKATTPKFCDQWSAHAVTVGNTRSWRLWSRTCHTDTRMCDFDNMNSAATRRLGAPGHGTRLVPLAFQALRHYLLGGSTLKRKAASIVQARRPSSRRPPHHPRTALVKFNRVQRGRWPPAATRH